MTGLSVTTPPLKELFPIGSIYINVNTTNPGTIFGGTWEQIKDTFLLCSGNTYGNGTTGGSATHLHSTAGHTLTVAEMPKHAHAVTSRMYNQGYNNGSAFTIDNYWNDPAGSDFYVLQQKMVTASVTDGYQVGALPTGGSNSHSHGNTGSTSTLPPYLAVTVWKRIA